MSTAKSPNAEADSKPEWLTDHSFWVRFWSQVEPHENEDGSLCLRWTGYTRDNNYGRIGWKNTTLLVHRVRVIDDQGPLDSEEHVHHQCTNNWCVRLDHLEVLENLPHQLEHSPWTKEDLRYLFRQHYLEKRSLREIAQEIDMDPKYAGKINAGEVWPGLDLGLDFDPQARPDSYRGEHNSQALLTEADIPIILHRHYIDKESQYSIAEDYPVRRSQIGHICRRKCWDDVPVPEYIKPYIPDEYLD